MRITGRVGMPVRGFVSTLLHRQSCAIVPRRVPQPPNTTPRTTIVYRQFSSYKPNMGWLDVSGYTLEARARSEELVLETHQKNDPLLVVGYHHTDKEQSNAALLITTVFPSKKEPFPLLAYYDKFLETLLRRSEMTSTPKKTLIMESKACCGIGTTGKILSLQEIQSKKREQVSLDKRIILHPEQIVWHDRTLAAETTQLRDGLQRTTWYWERPESAEQEDDDDDDDSRIPLGELFPQISSTDALEIMREVAEEIYEVYYNFEDCKRSGEEQIDFNVRRHRRQTRKMSDKPTSGSVRSMSTLIVPQEEEPSVPIVDLSLPLTDVGVQIHQACTTTGFFYLANHGVSSALCDNVLEQARHMFTTLTEEQKEAISVAHSNSYRGYQRMGVNVTSQQRDGHEALDLVSESKDAQRPPGYALTNYGQNQWPDPAIVPDLRPTIEQYIAAMNTVGQRLANATSLGLGLGPDFLRPYFTDPYWSMRLIRYPSVKDGAENDENDSDAYDFGVGEHTDYGVFTMILCDNVPGTLQIRPKGTSDYRWVDPIPDTFICNIGDMLARWTNNVYVSTPHRVLRPAVDRVSVPFFFDPNYTAQIAPIEAALRADEPPCFAPIMYGDHLLAKTSQNFKV